MSMKTTNLDSGSTSDRAGDNPGMANMEPNSTDFCTGCGKRCPLNDLQCGLGYRLLAEQQEGETGTSGTEAKSEHSTDAHGHSSRGQQDDAGHDGVHAHGHGHGHHHDHERGHHGNHHHSEGHDHAGGHHGRHHGWHHDHAGHRGHHHGGSHHNRHEGHKAARPEVDRTPVNDERLAHLFYHCARTLVRRQNSEGGRASALAVLQRHGAMTQAVLADKLDIRPASASELVTKMEADDLLTRTPSDSDGRALTLELTEAGKQEAEEVLERRRRADDDLFDALSADEKTQLQTILSTLAQSWRQAS